MTVTEGNPVARVLNRQSPHEPQQEPEDRSPEAASVEPNGAA